LLKEAVEVDKASGKSLINRRGPRYSLEELLTGLV